MGPSAARRRAGNEVGHRDVVDRLQFAQSGSVELDALVGQLLQSLSFRIEARGHAKIPAPRGSRWSCDLSKSLTLVRRIIIIRSGRGTGFAGPGYSRTTTGSRPSGKRGMTIRGGSGLIVANTAALAFISAAIMLYAKRLELLG